MTLRLPDHWVWDAWYAVDGDVVHAFFLHAPRALGDPGLRHFRARVGHAVSRDLVTWEVLPPALDAGAPGTFDDLATWTGSVIRDGDGWLMACTGVSRAEAGQVQRISFARSADLSGWERAGPVIEADPRWYETDRVHGEVHWRDPWLWRAQDGLLHILVTARANYGEPDGRGVIGHAWSADGTTWEVGPPVSEPGEMRQLEVPQLVELAPDRWVILACARSGDASAVRMARPGTIRETGTLVLEATAPLGPFTVAHGRFLHGDPGERSYAGRVVERNGERCLMTWTDQVDGEFVGELADPIPLDLDAGGNLRVAAEAAS